MYLFLWAVQYLRVRVLTKRYDDPFTFLKIFRHDLDYKFDLLLQLQIKTYLNTKANEHGIRVGLGVVVDTSVVVVAIETIKTHAAIKTANAKLRDNVIFNWNQYVFMHKIKAYMYFIKAVKQKQFQVKYFDHWEM